MSAEKNPILLRRARHQRVRKRVQGTPERPRLAVFRSQKHIYVQIIDDLQGHTLVAASTMDPQIRGELAGKPGGNRDAGKLVGTVAGRRALEAGISRVVFDRGGYKYHGRVQAIADGARESGLEF